MSLKNTNKRWGTVAQFFHWLTFLMFAGMFYVGTVMEGMNPKAIPPETLMGMDKYTLYGYHKEFGLLVLFIVFCRISWRMASKEVPNVPEGVSKLQHLAAKAMHGLLYVAMFVMPISGYVMSMAGGHGIKFFGMDVPNLIGLNKPLGGLAHTVHNQAVNIIYILVAVHVLAALYHHFCLKNDVLRRMLPFTK